MRSGRWSAVAALSLFVLGSFSFIPHASGAQLPCPEPYDYGASSGNPPNRCPTAALQPSFTTNSNCPYTGTKVADGQNPAQCFGANWNDPNTIIYHLEGQDSRDPDGDDLIYYWTLLGHDPALQGSAIAGQLVAGCSTQDSFCEYNAPYIPPSGPARTVVHWQLTVCDRTASAPDVRCSNPPAFVNVTILNGNQSPVIEDGGNGDADVHMRCLPTSSVPCGTAMASKAGGLSQDAVNIAQGYPDGDMHHDWQVTTVAISDDKEVTAVEAYFTDTSTGKALVVAPLQKGACSHSFDPETCTWSDTLVRAGQRAYTGIIPGPGVPIDTKQLLVGTYDIVLAVHDSDGTTILSAPDANEVEVVADPDPGAPVVGMYGVKAKAAATANTCFAGNTDMPTQIIGPGQSRRISVNFTSTQDGNGFTIDWGDPHLLLWKVTYQYCINGPKDAAGRPIPLYGKETELAEPFVLDLGNLPHTNQEVKIRAYDRMRRVVEMVVPLAIQADPPQVKVLMSPVTFLNLTTTMDVLTHDLVNHQVLVTVLNYTQANGVFTPTQDAQSTQNRDEVANIPNLNDSYLRDVTGDRYVDFLLDQDANGVYDHVFDITTRNITAILSKCASNVLTYTVDSNTNGKVDKNEATFQGACDGSVYAVDKSVLKCTACTDKPYDVDGDGVVDTLVSSKDLLNGPNMYDHFRRTGAKVDIPVLVAQQPCLLDPTKAGGYADDGTCLKPFEDPTLDLDGDGTPDVTFDSNADGVPEMVFLSGAPTHPSLVTANAGLWGFTEGTPKTYDPKMGTTLLGFLRQAATTDFEVHITRQVEGPTRYSLFVDDVTGNHFVGGGRFTTIRAYADAAITAVATSATSHLLAGDLVNVTATVSVLAGADGLPPVPVRILFDGQDGRPCYVNGVSVIGYPPLAGVGGSPVRACMRGADDPKSPAPVFFGPGRHHISAKAVVPTEVNDPNPDNDVGGTDLEVFLGAVVDGPDTYYIRASDQGVVPQLAGGAVQFASDSGSAVVGTHDLSFDQSGGHPVYHFNVTAIQDGHSVTKEIYWDPTARAHVNGAEAWPDAANPDAHCKPGHTPVDDACRAVTVASAPKGASSSSPAKKSPAGGAAFLAVLAVLAVAVRRRR